MGRFNSLCSLQCRWFPTPAKPVSITTAACDAMPSSKSAIVRPSKHSTQQDRMTNDSSPDVGALKYVLADPRYMAAKVESLDGLAQPSVHPPMQGFPASEIPVPLQTLHLAHVVSTTPSAQIMNVTPSCSYMIFTECLFCAASVSSRTAHTISPPCPLLVDVFINCSLQNGAGSRSCMPGHCEFNLILSTTLVTGGDTGSQVRAVMVQPLLITVATGSRAQPAAQHSKMLSTTKTCVFSFWWLNSD